MAKQRTRAEAAKRVKSQAQRKCSGRFFRPQRSTPRPRSPHVHKGGQKGSARKVGHTGVRQRLSRLVDTHELAGARKEARRARHAQRWRRGRRAGRWRIAVVADAHAEAAATPSSATNTTSTACIVSEQ